MELEFVLITIFLSLLSLLANFWVTYVYVKNKELHKHPSTILACISVFEIAMSHHSIALALETNFSINGHGPHHLIQALTLFQISLESSKNVSCGINQMMFAGSAAGVLCYNTFLCVDLIITIRNPLISGKERMKYYHFAAFCVIIPEMIYNVLWNLHEIECEMGALDYLYEVWNNGMLSFIYIGYIITAIVSVGYSGYKLNTKGQMINESTKDYLTKHIKYIIALSFIWSWSAICFWLDSSFSSSIHFKDNRPWVIITSLVLINISGFIQAVLRNWEKSFWVKSKELCSRRRLAKVNTIMSMDLSSSGIFNKDFKETEDMWNMPTSFIVQESYKVQATLCILLGIREVFCKEICYATEIVQGDTKEVKKHRVYFNNSGYEDTMTEFYGFPYFIVEEHCPKVFSQLRKLEGLNLESTLKSLSPENNQSTFLALNQGGSGSLFIFTEDGKYSIKIITIKERVFLQKSMLLGYFNHIKSHPFSFLNRILGLFTLKIPGLAPLNIVLSPGLVNETVDRFYDLKGSTYNRLGIRPEDRFFKGPFKDSDLINEKSGFNLHPKIRLRILTNIKSDAKFLMKHRIMDYSLLVCVLHEESIRAYPSSDHKTWYQFGIIDFLGEYSLKRKAEYYVKLLRLGKRIKMCSVMNPRSYYNRFMKFLSSTVFIES